MRYVSAVLFFFVTIISLAAFPHIYYPETVYPGDPLRIIGYDDNELESMVSRVKDSRGETVFRGEGFPFDIGDKTVWVSLLGIPCTLPEGEYTLIVDGVNNRYDFYIEKKLMVKNKEFIREDIPLNKSMSELRTTEDPRKARESRELLTLLRSFNKDALYTDGTFIDPLPGALVSSYFGDRRTYLYADGGMGSAIHFGIDLVKPTGTPIASCAAGKVVMAKTRIISGETVVLEHAPGVYSLYYHLDSIAVNQGETVEAGEIIGTVGATGLVTGAHLHWEVRFSGVPVAPGYLLEHNLLDKQSILSIISPD